MTEDQIILIIISIAVIFLYFLFKEEFKKTTPYKFKKQDLEIKNNFEVSEENKNQKELKNKDILYLNDDFGIPKKDFQRVCLLLGATGTGKTETLKKILKEFNNEMPVIFIDGKGERGAVDNYLFSLFGDDFYSFNSINYDSYNFMVGTPTELKDKIISLKEWESDYYKSIGSEYIQLVFELFKELNIELNLKEFIVFFEKRKLLTKARELKNETLKHSISSACRRIEEKELNGMYSHFSGIINSDMGKYFSEKGIMLDYIIKENKAMYFCLPALQYPEFSKLCGKLVINDIKGSIIRCKKPVLIIFDEFSIFAGEQVLNLINQGRSLGAFTILSTQGLSDLKEIEDQILNNSNILISHRVNSFDTAEKIAKYIGSKNSVKITRKISDSELDVNDGSFREVKEFIFHPDEIKNLNIGEVVVFNKIQNEKGKIKIKKI